MSDTMREAFEAWMINEAKIIVGSQDPYPAGLECDYWRVWQAAISAQAPAEPPAAERVWQPIETAPRDGSHVLLYAPELQFVGFYAAAGWCYVAPRCPLAPTQPAYWMPLPPAPNIQANQGGEVKP